MLQIFFCCVFWTLILVYIFRRLVITSKQAFSYLDRLHQIPCSKCVFFTTDYRLKCTVHPITAMTEESINCRDFISKSATTSDNSSQIFSSSCHSKCSKKHNYTF